MLYYLYQFNSSDYLPTSCKTQIESISQAIKAFKEPQLQEDNSIKTLKQAYSFKKIRLEKFTNNIIITASEQNLVNPNIKQLPPRKSSRYNIDFLKELLLSTYSGNSVIQSPLFKIIKNSSSSGIISFPAKKEEAKLSQTPSKSLVSPTKKEQTSSQNANNFHTSLAPLDEETHLRPNATIQIKILVKLYWQITRSRNKSVKWSPSSLLGKGATPSERASRSAAIKNTSYARICQHNRAKL